MKKLWRWLILKAKQAIRWVIRECKDKTTFIIFAIVWVIMMSPVWGGYLLLFITGNGWHATYATAYLLFWAGPFTPFLPLCLVITLAIKKILRIKPKNQIDNSQEVIDVEVNIFQEEQENRDSDNNKQ